MHSPTSLSTVSSESSSDSAKSTDLAIKPDKNSNESVNHEEGQTFEKVFDQIKHYGKYQFFTFILVQYIMLNSAGNYVFISFATLKPDCGIKEVNAIQDVCQRIKACPSNQTRSVFHSLYEDSQFVCPNTYLPNHMQTVQAIGSGVGALLGGHIADAFGRKWVTSVGAFFMTFCGFCGGLAPNSLTLFICMLGMGLAYGVLIDSLMTLASEQVGPRYRIVQTLAFQWTLSIQVASLIAWLSQDWRKYLIAVNLICSPVLIIMHLLWVESPRWLIQRQRFAEAARCLNRIAKWNGSTARCQIYSLRDLFVGRKLCAYSVVMVLSALTVELCGGVLIFDLQVLAGDPFLNMILYGVLRIWTPFFVVFVETHSKSIGRRGLFLCSQGLAILCYGAVLALSMIPGTAEVRLLRTVLSLAGAILNSSIFFTAYKQFSVELYPTLMRAIAIGTFGVVERVGGALAPQLISLNSRTWHGSALSVATALMAASFVAGWLVLPETRNQDMPDAVDGSEINGAEDRKRFRRTNSQCSEGKICIEGGLQTKEITLKSGQ